MADAILVTTRLMCQVPRPAQLEPVFLLIQQQQTRKLRERVVKGRCQLRRRFRKPLKRHVQRYFFVPRIHKRLDLQRWSRQRARSRHILQFQERPGQQRRKHGAKVNWQDQGALGQKISQRARHPSAHRPLRAIAVAIRLRRVLSLSPSARRTTTRPSASPILFSPPPSAPPAPTPRRERRSATTWCPA